MATSAPLSASFELLDDRIKRAIWAQGWDQLRAAQEAAIPHVVEADRDVIIAAATAAGKTEAAMLPALTHLLRKEPVDQAILYLSPLKALINDQFHRLVGLCETLEVPVVAWHGDISSGMKSRFLKDPRGVLLITPESMEALLCTKGGAVPRLLGRLALLVIDELHAFIGSERGKQLQSLLHRLDLVLGRHVPRVGLSATLGDMRLGAEFLRPAHADDVRIVTASSGAGEVRVIVKGYQEPAVIDRKKAHEPASPALIAQHLFETLRGSNNLVFPNSRREVERYTHLLTRLCQRAQAPVEFWPHHGSLSKELRADTESALKRKDLPATAVCTSTLELGIDLGAVKSVAQIGPPPSVAALRQRLGRSGRRKGEPAILRGYAIEDALVPDCDVDVQLRTGTIQLAAMVALALEGWFEPPAAAGVHLSTLVQQVLSLIAQMGGVTAQRAYQTLCGQAAPFQGVSRADFAALLRHLAAKDLLMQDSAGTLLHGPLGERIVNHFSFYAAFAADEEYRLLAGGKPLGSLPVSQALMVGQRILFAGQTWRVDQVSDRDRTIVVSRAGGGAPPLFAGDTGRVHTRVRERMREILAGKGDVPFLDRQAQLFLEQARRAYSDLALERTNLLDTGAQIRVFTWLGDAANEVICLLLLRKGLTAGLAGVGLDVQKDGLGEQQVGELLASLAGEPLPPIEDLLAGAANLEREKWDWALPPALLCRSYASVRLDVVEARQWLSSVASQSRK
ncbi:DEAD/DEAH box helicase [Rubrivivax gelatinosus]|uniref:DEAD/DEAH box helicase n=1 Tax=Rubrivivax gelatinosus TaxID=28068 RepID=UPI0003008B54|nr:DEAD/DEAH box helicase [Rubrivivax gelatinosus]MBG6083044.1 ATP-dependent Lhr-like helicase [Rubrivivax gelatinosus]